MKRFLLSLVVLVAFTGVTFAAVPLAPEVTVESVDDSINTTVEIALQYAMNSAISIMEDVGIQANGVIDTLQYTTASLTMKGVDASELTLLCEEAEKNYREARTLFSSGSIYLELGDILVRESKDAEGTAAYVLRAEAVVRYYEAASYLERSRTALDTVIALGVKGAAIAKELENRPTEDKVTGRYHLRGRVNRFFSRSRGRRV